MKYFVVSDIHGSNLELHVILDKYNPEEEMLIFLGDYIDRGQDSVGVLQTLMTLHAKYGQDRVKFIRGNHDQMFLDALIGDREAYHDFAHNGGMKFVSQVLDLEYGDNKPFYVDALPAKKQMALCQKHLAKEISFLENQTLPYYQGTSFLFTHAGFDSNKEDWRETSLFDFRWIRKHYYRPNTTGYINIFGHTRTSSIRGDKTNRDIWISPCQTYIGIDGGCSYGGQLNAIVVDSENSSDLIVYEVQHGGTTVTTKHLNFSMEGVLG